MKKLTINLASLPENYKGGILKVTNQSTEEYLTIEGIEEPVYRHKSIIHRILFNLFGWPQPKIIRGALLNVKRFKP